MDEHPGRGWDGALPAPAPIVRGARAPSLAARLDAWVADARVEGSADARARERWLQSAAEADATFTGVLLDLAERQVAVAVATCAGRRHHGLVEVVGADFVALRSGTGAEVLLAVEAISSARTAPLVAPAVGERVVTTELRLTDVLAELATDRARVLLVLASGGDSVAGELQAVGHDVVTLRTDGGPAAVVYVPSATIGEVALG